VENKTVLRINISNLYVEDLIVEMKIAKTEIFVIINVELVIAMKVHCVDNSVRLNMLIKNVLKCQNAMDEIILPKFIKLEKIIFGAIRALIGTILRIYITMNVNIVIVAE